MMSIRLQWALIIASIATLVFVVYVIVRHRMSIKYSIIWIIWTLLVLLIGIFPGIGDLLSRTLSISSPVNTIFLIMLFLLYLISFYAYLKISLQERKINDLNYRIAVVDKQLQELKPKEEKKEC